MYRPIKLAARALLVPAFVVLSVRAYATDPNSFNRLHTAPGERNAPPGNDGLHDATLEGTGILQPPREAFDSLPKSMGGNYVDWVSALKSGKIAPRYDKDDAKAKPEIMDLDIIREVKGTIPDVVYPHAAHAEWVDCAVCHPAIFEPTKGANTMTMAEIMLGQKCGVCHGTVAFPVSECKRCHMNPKPGMAQSNAPKGGEVKRTTAGKKKSGLRLPWSD